MKSITIKVYVHPGAKKSEVVGMHGDAVKIRIHSPSVEGKANDALIVFLSKIMGVRKSSLQIEKGDKSRTKTIAIYFDSEADLMAIENKLIQFAQSND